MALPNRDVLLLFFALLLMLVFNTNGQQCLDLMPPFIPTSPLQFCEPNSKYSCCTADDDARLEQMLNLIRHSIVQNGDTLSRECLQYLKSLLCAKCSPLSAEIFQESITRYKEPLIPGLCGPFCDQFYRKCANVTEHYLAALAVTGTTLQKTIELNALTSSSDSTWFCEAVSLPMERSHYCYPNVGYSFGETARFTSEIVNTVGCLCFQPYNISLTNPVTVTHGNDGTGRLFIAEQNGVVKVIYPDGTIFADNYLDIQYKVFRNGDGFKQLGLLGMALHPKFKENHKLYVFYTFKRDLSSLSVRVEEYRANGEDDNIIDPNKNRVILEFKKETNIHAGGPLVFGKDGYLYIFTGDDGGEGDAMETSQDLFMLSGKVLRINVDVTDFVRGKEYSIPNDNPFAGREHSGLPEIYAWGLRNPRGCSTERKSMYSGKSGGRIFCGDVGMDTFEEVNIIKKNANYGWNIKEGTADFCPECLRGSPNVSLTDPVFEYRHTIGTSVVGGHVYRGCLNPNLYDQYIFGDVKQGILRLKEKKDKWIGDRLGACSPDKCKAPLTNEIQPYIHAFGEDEQGELYVLTTSQPNMRSATGRIFKIVDPIRRGNPENCNSARPDDGISAVTGKYYPAATAYPVLKTEPQVSQSTSRNTPEQQRVPEPPRREQQQQTTNQRGRPGFFGRLFGINRRRNEEDWDVENRNEITNTSSTNFVQSILNRPDVQQAIDLAGIQNPRIISSDTGKSRDSNPSASENAMQVRSTDNEDVSSAVNSILRAAGLVPAQPQDRATSQNLGIALPHNQATVAGPSFQQNTAVNRGAILPQTTAVNLGTLLSQNTGVDRRAFVIPQAASVGPVGFPQTGAVSVRTKRPQSTNVGKGTALSQNRAIDLGTILPPNTAAKVVSLDAVFPRRVAAAIEAILRENTAAGRSNAPTILQLARGSGTILRRNAAG